jgi:hypothetical protein
MSECLHCEINELLESRLQGQEVNLAEVAAKVTEVLADLILMAPPDEQSTLMADKMNVAITVVGFGDDQID